MKGCSESCPFMSSLERLQGSAMLYMAQCTPAGCLIFEVTFAKYMKQSRYTMKKLAGTGMKSDVQPLA